MRKKELNGLVKECDEILKKIKSKKFIKFSEEEKIRCEQLLENLEKTTLKGLIKKVNKKRKVKEIK